MFYIRREKAGGVHGRLHGMHITVQGAHGANYPEISRFQVPLPKYLILLVNDGAFRLLFSPAWISLWTCASQSSRQLSESIHAQRYRDHEIATEYSVDSAPLDFTGHHCTVRGTPEQGRSLVYPRTHDRW